MAVQAGPAGARVVCAEAGANSGQSKFTCEYLQLLPPAGAAVAAAAPLAIDCASCTGQAGEYMGTPYACCSNARVENPPASCLSGATASADTTLQCGPDEYVPPAPTGAPTPSPTEHPCVVGGAHGCDSTKKGVCFRGTGNTWHCGCVHGRQGCKMFSFREHFLKPD